FFYNINFPALARNEIKGLKKTVISSKKMIESFEKRQNPYGVDYYWHVYADVNAGSNGGYGSVEAGEEGRLTDVDAVAQGYISITPLKLDYLDHKKFRETDDFADIFFPGD
ncbi:MAG: hypothetical protein Q4C00_08620, partial [Bacillota bacterium]|nr:hypothetical protein [Bacillota bacterium]